MGLMLLVLCCLTTVPVLAARDMSIAVDAELVRFNREGDFALLKPHVLEERPFYGLASYYNSVAFYKFSANGLELLEPNQNIRLAEAEQFAAVGRYNVLQLTTPGIELALGEENFNVIGDKPLQLNARLVRKDQLKVDAPELDQLRYQHLWFPFAVLARAVEWSLVQLQMLGDFGWGVTIVLFTLLLKILLVPLGILTVGMQRDVSQHQALLAPKLADIKSKYDGEEAHKRIMAAHKELGISTFFALKPLLATFIQVPVWIAVFNALGEMPQLSGEGFLWIENLAYPDSIATLPMTLPVFGNSVSLLPILMTVVTIVSARLFQDRHAPEEELKRQKRNLYMMALAFFVLFYPFPAAMVLYWTLSNALQILQQQKIKV